MAVTSFEKGIERGIEQGIEQGQVAIILSILEEKFGPVSPETAARVRRLPAPELLKLARRVMHAGSLQDLGLEN